MKILQRELRLVADGIFGKQTLQTVKLQQLAGQLKDDGIVGPATWALLLGDDYTP